MGDHDDGDLEHFDPNQSLDERREIQRHVRDLMRKTAENQEDLLSARPTLYAEMLREADDYIHQIKQTFEATVDSRLILNVAETAYRRSNRLTAGAGTIGGVDVDELVSKCITYMKHGRGIADDSHAELSSTQHRRRRRTAAGGSGSRDEDGDEDGDDGDTLNWAHFGKYACVPYVRRPALPGLLLGPLSVERKARKVAKRTAPLRINSLHEVRPEVLDPEAMQAGANAEKGDLTATCTRIFRLLCTAVTEGQQACIRAVEEELPEHLREDEDARRPLYDRFALRDTGGIDLLRFAVNPRSFAQTVENMFYISFLIRDGKVNLDFDDDGLPSISAVDDDDDGESTERSNPTRHQAIIELDQAKWREVIDVFNITESIIPHRADADHSGPGARGWYSS
ncbi:hypothetical protein RB595_009859 [Gaeumannomyces hyphopodioides]